MATLIYLDTHVVVWLYAPRLDLISPAAQALINDNDLLISPLVLLELEYLKDVGRLSVGGNTMLESMHAQIGLRLCDLEFAKVMRVALEQRWTRDPFDRVIVGQAAVSGRTLVTRDDTIRSHYAHATW